MRIGTEKEYSNFIKTCSLGFRIDDTILFADLRNADKSDLQEKANSLTLLIRQPKYFHSDTYSTGLLFSIKGEGLRVRKPFPKSIDLVFAVLKTRPWSVDHDRSILTVLGGAALILS